MIVDALILFVVGVVVGFINTLAGSGSFLTLPVLIMMGLTSQEANATNRIAIFFQTLVGVVGFDKAKKLDRILSFKLSVAVLPGALLGSILIVRVPEKILSISLAVLMLIFAILTLTKPMHNPEGNEKIKPSLFHYLLYFLIGIYGGAIQAGVGIFFLFASTLLLKLPLVKANAIKLVLTFLFTPVSIAVFLFHHQINWMLGLILAAGSVVGALLSVRFSLKKDEKYVRIVLFFVLIASSIKMVFDALK